MELQSGACVTGELARLNFQLIIMRRECVGFARWPLGTFIIGPFIFSINWPT